MRRETWLNPGAFLVWVARAGFAARGFVYLMAGLLSFLAALEWREKAAGTRGALTTLGHWPLGPVWLFAVGIGLAAFAAFRIAQALFDLEGKGRSLLGLAVRAGRAVSGAVYGFLGFSALDLSDSLRALDPNDPGHADLERFYVAPFGREILIGVGVCVAVAALGNAAKAVGGHFDGDLRCGPGAKRWAVPLGRIGYAARGGVFGLFAFVAVETALDLQASDVRSVGGALAYLEARTYGRTLLALAAAGLVAFGAYGFVEALFHRHGRDTAEPDGAPALSADRPGS